MKLKLISEADIPLTTSYDSAVKTLVKHDCTLITKALADAGYEPIGYYGRLLCYHDPHFGPGNVPFIKYIASARCSSGSKDLPKVFIGAVEEAFGNEGRDVEVGIPGDLKSHVHTFTVTVSRPS